MKFFMRMIDEDGNNVDHFFEAGDAIDAEQIAEIEVRHAGYTLKELRRATEEEFPYTKVEQWKAFSRIVESHIRQYAVPQYGDFPSKTVGKWNDVKIQGKLEAYVDRIGTGQRGKDDAIRDALKIADFAKYLYAYLTTGSAEGRL